MRLIPLFACTAVAAAIVATMQGSSMEATAGMLGGLSLIAGIAIQRRGELSADLDKLGPTDRILRTLVDSVVNQSVVVHDQNDSKVVYANVVACRHFGVPLETLLTWRSYDFDPHMNEDLGAQIVDALAEQGVYTFETEHRVASGELIPVEVTISRLSLDDRAYSLTFIQDLRPRREAEAHARQLQRLEDEGARKQVEDRLAQREREFRTLIENAPDNIVHYDSQARILYINPVLEKTLGLSAEEVIGKRNDELYPNLQPVREYQRILGQVLQTGEPAEYLMISGSDHFGRPLYDNIRIAPEISDGRVIGAIAIGRDITRQKQLEENLAQREQEFRTLAENSPDMIIRYDLEFRRTYVNQAFLVASGLPLEQVLGKRVVETGWWSSNVSAAEFEQFLRQAAASREPTSVRLHGNSPTTGSIYHMLVLIVPEFDIAGSVISLMAVVRDVTDLVSTEQELRRREQYQRALLDNFPFFVWLKDLDSHLLAANQQYARVARLPSPKDVEGKTDFDLFPHDLAAGYIEDDRLVLASGTPKNVVERFCDEHGELRWMETYKSPVTMNGEVIGTVGFSRDISDQVQVQHELTQREQELRLLVDSSPDVIIRYDRDCRRTYVSRNYERVYGTPACSALGKKPTEQWSKPRITPEDYENWLQWVMTTGKQADTELDWYDADGEYLCQALRAVPEYDSDGNIVSVLTFSRDVSEIKRVEKKLLVSEQEYRTLVEHSPDIVIRYGLDCQRTYVNSAFEKATGFSAIQSEDVKLSSSWRPQNITSAEYEARLRHVIASGEPANIQLEWTENDSRLVSFDVRVIPEYEDTEGQVIGLLAIGHNITQLREAEEILRQREQEFRALVEHSPDTIARYDQHCHRVYANPRMVKDSGAELDELLGKTPIEFPGGSQAEAYQNKIREVLSSGQGGDYELNWRTADGKSFCSHIRLTPEFDVEGKVASVLSIGRDITEIDTYRKQIHDLAFFDSLTALPNRALLTDRISQTIADAEWHGSQFGLMLLDLDRFKEVNDTLGHGVGDLLLREVADRLLDCVRSYDTVARLGGDEFAVLLPEVRESADLGTIARKILNAFLDPFVIGSRELFVSSSIGIALFPEDSVEIDELFKFADSAMYHAKKQGRNNFQFYAAELTARSAERMTLEAALRRARRNDELELYYQPQVDLRSGHIVGAEALLRWNHPEHGLVSPDKFIAIAEETGLIVDIGEWVLATACAAAAQWNRDRITPLKVAVNLSTRQFILNDLHSQLHAILSQTGCRAQWLELEITESLLLEDSEDIAKMLAAFSEMGLSISIDDFGTGYSALSYLNRFPVSQIKIDRSFVNGIPADHDKAELVKAMVSIAHALDLDLVAEGVENHAQADYLAAYGCRTAQGYLFGKPMTRAAFEACLMSPSIVLKAPHV